MMCALVLSPIVGHGPNVHVPHQVYQRISSFVSSSEWYFEHLGDQMIDHSTGGSTHAELSAHNGNSPSS